MVLDMLTLQWFQTDVGLVHTARIGWDGPIFKTLVCYFVEGLETLWTIGCIAVRNPALIRLT